MLLVEDEYEDLASATEFAFEPLIVPATEAPQQRVSVKDDDGLLLIYTSGTTGKPKGALLTHANCFWTNLSLDLTTPMDHDDVVLQVLPQFHCGGWNVQPLLAWWKGATVVLERAFDAGRALELIEQAGVTTIMGVPSIYLFCHSIRDSPAPISAVSGASSSEVRRCPSPCWRRGRAAAA